jgi:hypothetical protein
VLVGGEDDRAAADDLPPLRARHHAGRARLARESLRLGAGRHVRGARGGMHVVGGRCTLTPLPLTIPERRLVPRWFPNLAPIT